MGRPARPRKGALPPRSGVTTLEHMSENVQVEGGGAWAAQQIAQGHPVRSRGWFAGSLHPHAEDPSRIFFRSGRPLDGTDATEDRDLGSAAAYFARHGDEVWELATTPRRSTASAATVIDLACFPDALPVGMVRSFLEKHAADQDDFGNLIAWVWQQAKQTLVGQALRAFLQHEGIRVNLQLARQGDPAARTAILEAITALRDGR